MHRLHRLHLLHLITSYIFHKTFTFVCAANVRSLVTFLEFRPTATPSVPAPPSAGYRRADYGPPLPAPLTWLAGLQGQELRPHESPGCCPGRPESPRSGAPSGNRTHRRTSNRPGAPGTSQSRDPSDRPVTRLRKPRTSQCTIPKHYRAYHTGPNDSVVFLSLDVCHPSRTNTVCHQAT